MYRALRGRRDSGLVTGEGVLLDIPAASFPQRMASGLIDVIATLTGLIGSLILLATTLDDVEPVLAQSIVILLIVFWLLVLPTTVETLTRGRSLGKLIVGLRTVRDDGGPIVMRHALTRALVGVIEVYATLGTAAMVAGIATERSRRLGDLAAGTAVVRVRSKLPPAPPLPMPPQLAQWAAAADMAPLPDRLALGIRQLLARRGDLAPQARHALGQSLLQESTQYVAPPPPPGHPDEVVLAAILAERRRRDAVRLGREQELRQRVLPPLS